MYALRYGYSVIRYVHDSGASESLNIGVVMVGEGFFEAKVETRYERLSHAFQGFDGDSYRNALARFQGALHQLRRDNDATPLFADHVRTVNAAIESIWPDTATSFTFSEPRSGVTNDLSAELAMLYQRMVSIQQPGPDENARRDDEQLWRQVYSPKLPAAVLGRLRPKKFVTNDVEVAFDRAIKNGKWHVIQPVSMDFKAADGMQRKAAQWLGTTVGLSEVSELGTIYFLLGAPKGGHRKAYERAKHLIGKSPVPHEIIEERQAEDLSRKLEALISGLHG